MSTNNVIDLKNPEPFIDDPITDIFTPWSKKIVAPALKAEIELLINQYKELEDHLGRQRILHNGYLPEREFQTGIGTVKMSSQRARVKHVKPSRRSDSHHPYPRLLCAKPKALNIPFLGCN